MKWRTTPLRSLHWYAEVGRSAANVFSPVTQRRWKGWRRTASVSAAVASVTSPSRVMTPNAGGANALTSMRSRPSQGTSTPAGATIHVRGSFRVSPRRNKTRTRSSASTKIRHCQPASNSKRTESADRPTSFALTSGRMLSARERRLAFGGIEEVGVDNGQGYRHWLTGRIRDLAWRMHGHALSAHERAVKKTG